MTPGSKRNRHKASQPVLRFDLSRSFSVFWFSGRTNGRHWPAKPSSQQLCFPVQNSGIDVRAGRAPVAFLLTLLLQSQRFAGVKILKVKNLSGPNVWANFPVLEVWVDLESFWDSPSDSLPGFNERLMNWLPTMIEHRCSIGERGGFFERLRRGTWLGHILEHTTLELQTLAGTEVGFGRARETSTEGIYRVAIEYQAEPLARAALDTAFRLLMAAIHDREFDVAAEITALQAVAEDACLGPSTKSIVDAAARQGIPWRRMTDGNLIRLGHGIRQKKIMAAETDATSAIAESIAQDKELTRQLLQEVGISVPEGGPVANLPDALRQAAEISGPVVVKPRCGNKGRGVSTNLATPEQVTAAYHAARLEESSVVVERFIPGQDYRLLVVGNKLIAAAHRVPAMITGDGINNVATLVRQLNADSRRGEGHGSPLTRVKLDENALTVLSEQGVTPESVPNAGCELFLRRNANLSTGGTATDITDEVHPEFAARAIEAAKVVGLDVAGIDIVALDHRIPLDASNGAIVEVNAAPGLRMHLSPSSGTPRDVGAAIVEQMFGKGETGRIPTIAVTGVNGKTTVTRLIAHIVRGDGSLVGMTCTDGIWIGDRRIDNGDCSGPASAKAVLAHPQVEAAVLETARGGILRAGLGFDRCDVAVVTNIGEGDHLGLEGIDTLEKLALVKRTIVDVVQPEGTAVLNAVDPLVAPMSEKCPGRTMMFAIDEHQPVLAAHRSAGHPVIFVRHGSIVIVENGVETIVDILTNIPITLKGQVEFQVENVLAATAAVFSLRLPLPQIQLGLRTFLPTLQQSPGRFNLLEINGATVVVDYGHNPSALEALIKGVETLPGNRRSVVYSTAGDRRNCDIERQGEQLGNHFDTVYVYEGHYKRGRADGETVALFQAGLQRGTRAKDVVTVEGSLAAAELALNNLRAGDLLLLQADAVDETVDFLTTYLQKTAAVETLKNAELPNRVSAAEDNRIPTSAVTIAAMSGATPQIHFAAHSQPAVTA